MRVVICEATAQVARDRLFGVISSISYTSIFFD